jgi:hypothetical protein
MGANHKTVKFITAPAEHVVASVCKSGLNRSAVSQRVEACQLLAVMRRIQRRKYAELADIIKSVVADSTVPEMLQALPVIEACDAFLAALAADILDEAISNGFLAAIDQLMQSGTKCAHAPLVPSPSCADCTREESMRTSHTATGRANTYKNTDSKSFALGATGHGHNNGSTECSQQARDLPQPDASSAGKT